MSRAPQAGATIRVRVQPRASSDEIVGYRGDVLRVRVSAPPEGGKANEAVVSLLAGALGIARSRVYIVRGMTSRDKLVQVERLAAEEVQRRLGGCAG